MSALSADLAGPLLAIQLMDGALKGSVVADLMQAGYSDDEARQILLDGFVLAGVNIAIEEEMAPEAVAAHLESFAARLRSGESAQRARETQEALAAWLATQAPSPEAP